MIKATLVFGGATVFVIGQAIRRDGRQTISAFEFVALILDIEMQPIYTFLGKCRQWCHE